MMLTNARRLTLLHSSSRLWHDRPMPRLVTDSLGIHVPASKREALHEQPDFFQIERQTILRTTSLLDARLSSPHSRPP